MVFLPFRNERETVALIKGNRPHRVGPGTDEDWLRAQFFYVMKKRRSDATALRRRSNVGVSHQSDVSLILNSHHAQYFLAFLCDPEDDPTRNLVLKLIRAHVRVVPPILGDDAAICPRCVVHDSEDHFKIRFDTLTDQQPRVWHPALDFTRQYTKGINRLRVIMNARYGSPITDSSFRSSTE